MTHGTRSGYAKHGCRCRSCKDAQAAYMREYAKRPAPASKKRELKRRSRANRVAQGLPANAWTEASKAAYQRRRAATRGAHAEHIRPTEVYERDGWRCGICSEAVDRNLAWPNPLSVSLDHIVPLSLGGEHVEANVRCSHLVCNTKRGNRVA